MKTIPATSCFRRALCALVFVAGSSAFGAAVTFYAAGELPGGDYFSQFRDAARTPAGILAVGTLARYSPESPGDTSAMWTPATGWRLLASNFPLNPAQSFVAARVIALGGRVIGGSTRTAALGNSRAPCFWTNNGTTVTELGYLGGAGFPNVGLNCLSADASVAYGFTRWSGGPNGSFRYTAAGGMVSLGTLHPGDDTCGPSAHAVSSDGRVMLGNSYNRNLPFQGLSAFRYTYTGAGPTGGTMIALPALPNGTFTFTLALTPDAATAIGVSDSAGFPNGQLVRWDKHGHVRGLGSPNIALYFVNLGGVTVDGKVVAVSLADFVTEANGVCYIHNSKGWFNLQTIISNAGVDLTGWTLDTITGMSSDGRLVYGSGQHNGKGEAWVTDFAKGYLRAYGDDDNEDSDPEEGRDD